MTVNPNLHWTWLWILGDIFAPLQGCTFLLALPTNSGFLNCVIYATTTDIIRVTAKRSLRDSLGSFNIFSKGVLNVDTTPFLQGSDIVINSPPVARLSQESYGDLASRIVYDYIP